MGHADRDPAVDPPLLPRAAAAACRPSLLLPKWVLRGELIHEGMGGVSKLTLDPASMIMLACVEAR